MSIQIRDIPSDHIVALAPKLSGLYIQTGSVDHNGRLVTGYFQEARLMEDGQRIAITLTRYLNGKHVLDSVVVPGGNDPLATPGGRQSTSGPTANCLPGWTHPFLVPSLPDRRGAPTPGGWFGIELIGRSGSPVTRY